MDLRALKALIPWRLRLIAKILLARVPVSFSTWRRLALFQHGAMHDGNYVWFVYERHLQARHEAGALEGRTLLELGPGDGIATGLLASCLGAERTLLVDAGNFATRDVEAYRTMFALWRERGVDTRHLEACETFEELCEMGRTAYLTEGLESLCSLPTASVDFIFSNAVLEHVRLAEFDATQEELARILHPRGLARHAVDLKDHLGGALNNLRFRRERWESPLFVESGFYTNRLRYQDLLERFRNAGFDPRVTQTWTWSELPTPRSALLAEFRDLPEEDLLVWGFDVELRRVVPNRPDRGKHAANEVPAALARRPETLASGLSQSG